MIQIENVTLEYDTPGGKVRYMTAETGKDLSVENLEWNDSVVANLEAFALASRGVMVRNWDAGHCTSRA